MRKMMIIVIGMVSCLLLFIPHQSQAKAQQVFGWGYKKNSDHTIPEVGKYGDILAKHHAYYVDHSGKKVLYLTFDNGYEQGYTDDILDVLKKDNVPATFFVTGHYVNDNPELVKRMVKDGHIIGNHTNHHPDLTNLSKSKMKKELDDLENKVAAITPQKTTKYLRPPKGTFDDQTLKWADDLGYFSIFWSLAFADWKTNDQKGGDYAYDQIMSQIHPGAIILLHAVSKDNAEALDRVIKTVQKKGYQFKSLDDLVLPDLVPKGIMGL